MDYHIANPSGDKIASFKNEADRDVCLDAMNEYYELEKHDQLTPTDD